MLPNRRRVLIASAIGAMATGCVGDEYDTRDDVPHPMDGDDTDDEFDASARSRILEFAESSAETLIEANRVLEAWESTPEGADLVEIDRLRVAATSHLGTYDSIVAPNLEDVAALQPGTSTNGDEWLADGSALADILPEHEPLLFHVEQASIGIVNAGGDPEATSNPAWTSIGKIFESAEAVVAETRSALTGKSTDP